MATRLPVLVGGVVLTAAVCALLVMFSMHAPRSPAAYSKGGAELDDAAADTSVLAVPAVFSGSQELLNEYHALAKDLGKLKRQVARMRNRLRDEAQPPNVAGLSTVRRAAARLASVPNPDSAVNSFVRSEESLETDSIFASIASFRDKECGGTIENMYAMAKRPQRLFMGVIEQNEPEDRGMECMPSKFTECPHNTFCPSDNIRIRKVMARHAKGPTFGRYVAMLMYRGERYFLLLDSHNRFVNHWDYRMIQELHRAPSKKAVLSHYPTAYTGPGQNLDQVTYVTVMCNAHFIGTGFLRMDGMVMERSALPRLQPFSAAGFLFADASLVLEVPFDPYLDYVFDGEEILYSARMWTHGWDLYAPSQNLLFHFYGRPDAPRVWSIPNNKWWEHQQVSNARVQLFLGSTHVNTTTRLVTPESVRADPKMAQHDKDRLLAEMDKYGLGKERSLEDYWKFAMIDPVKRQAGNDYCNKARQLGRG